MPLDEMIAPAPPEDAPHSGISMTRVSEALGQQRFDNEELCRQNAQLRRERDFQKDRADGLADMLEQAVATNRRYRQQISAVASEAVDAQQLAKALEGRPAIVADPPREDELQALEDVIKETVGNPLFTLLLRYSTERARRVVARTRR